MTQEPEQLAFAMQLRGADGQGHRQAAAEQDEGVEASQPELEMLAGQGEFPRRKPGRPRRP